MKPEFAFEGARRTLAAQAAAEQAAEQAMQENQRRKEEEEKHERLLFEQLQEERFEQVAQLLQIAHQSPLISTLTDAKTLLERMNREGGKIRYFSRLSIFPAEVDDILFPEGSIPKEVSYGDSEQEKVRVLSTKYETARIITALRKHLSDSPRTPLRDERILNLLKDGVREEPLSLVYTFTKHTELPEMSYREETLFLVIVNPDESTDFVHASGVERILSGSQRSVFESMVERSMNDPFTFMSEEYRHSSYSSSGFGEMSGTADL